MVLNTDWVQVEAIDLTSDGLGWGFGITGGRSTGVVVKVIVPGGVADRDGRLQSGDHIIQIADINLRGMGSEQVAMVLRQSGSQVRLIVARPVEPTSPDYHILHCNSLIIPIRILGDPDELDRQLTLHQQSQNGITEPFPYNEAEFNSTNISYQEDSIRPEQDTQQECQSLTLNSESKLEVETFDVELIKDEQGLGIIVAGYVFDQEEISGIFVKSIVKGSAADLSGKIQVNDQIIQVNGQSLYGFTNSQAVQMLRDCGSVVTIRLARYIRGEKYHQLQHIIRDTFLTYEEETIIKEKWTKIVGADYKIVVAELIKSKRSTDLGFTLEGTVNQHDGQEIFPHHYIHDIIQGSPAAVDGRLCIGDELLEVNGVQTFGKNYTEVISALKKLPSYVCLVCARQTSDDHDLHWSFYDDANKSIKYNHSKKFCKCGQLSANEILHSLPLNKMKAKSDSCLNNLLNINKSESIWRSRTKSLEPLRNLAVWSSDLCIIELEKNSRGLGFSMMNYQDLLRPSETVLVVRSLVPGGVAQKSGKLLPGDRIMFVNDINLHNATLKTASKVLKELPKGLVQLGVCQPLIVSTLSFDQIYLEESKDHQSSNSELICNGKAAHLQEDVEEYIRNSDLERAKSPTLSSLLSIGVNSLCSTPLSSPAFSPGFPRSGFDIPPLPTALERLIRIKKGNSELGITVDLADKGVSGIVVKFIKVNSAAYSDSRIQVGDYLLSVNNENMRNVTRSQARAILGRCELLSTDILVKYIPAGDAAVHQQSAVLAQMHKGRDSPFSVISRQPSPRIFPRYYRSPYFQLKVPKDSEKDEQEAEDGRSSLFSFLSEDISAVPTPTSFSTDHSVHHDLNFSMEAILSEEPKNLFTKSQKDVNSLEAFQIQSGMNSPLEMENSCDSINVSPTPSSNVDPSSPVISAPGCQWGLERVVELWRDPSQGLGITIIWGQVEMQQFGTCHLITGIFIKNVVPDSPAGRNGSLNRGDRIIEVAGVDLHNISYKEAVEVIKTASNPVKFVVQSLVPWPQEPSLMKYPNDLNEAQISNSLFNINNKSITLSEMKNSDQNMLNDTSQATWKKINVTDPDTIQSDFQVQGKMDLQTDMHYLNSYSASDHTEKPPADHKSLSSSSGGEELKEIEEDLEIQGRVLTKRGIEIDRASAGFIKLLPEENDYSEEEDDFGYTWGKIKKKYGDKRGKLLIVELHRGRIGLGLSLVGNKDRTKMSVFVCGIHPKGNAAKNGNIKVGDELLEVNGRVLWGRCHLSASALIKNLASSIYKIILLRRENALDAMAVRPITHFPVSVEDQNLEDIFSKYPGVKTITARKGNHGLGIMIMEGKHSEIGQGIFISDVQEDSPADQAGLLVGDMILSVNETQLLGADYEAAASILKQTEGPITLVVANPNRLEQNESNSENKNNYKLLNQDKEIMQNDLLSGKDTDSLYAPLILSSPISGQASDSIGRSESVCDPLTCSIRPGVETKIHIFKDKLGLGLGIVGGIDTPLGAIVIHEIYPNGAVAADGRLRAGDQVLEVNGISVREVSHEFAVAVLRQPVPEIQMVVYRESDVHEVTSTYLILEVELFKKAGRGLGLSIMGRRNGPGVFISEVMRGGVAEADGQLMKGDQILEVNGEDLRNSTQELAAMLLKTIVGKVSMKIGRLKGRCE